MNNHKKMNSHKKLSFNFRFSLLSLVLILSPVSQAAKDGIDLAEYKGKIVYLDFWASWCVPCRESFPWLNQIQRQYAEDLIVISINLDKDRSLADQFLATYPANFKVIYDPKGKLASYYKIQGMPSSILFNRDGSAVSAHKGFFIKKLGQYESEIARLVERH